MSELEVLECFLCQVTAGMSRPHTSFGLTSCFIPGHLSHREKCVAGHLHIAPLEPERKKPVFFGRSYARQGDGDSLSTILGVTHL